MTEIVGGVDGLRPAHGPLFAVIGVFDGLHRGHVYLLEHLVREARVRGARPGVITFDAHPDEVLTGHAPPLLIHPDERLERLSDAGVEVTVVQHFDDAVRRTPYDTFLGTIDARASLAGLLMTPDAAFGFERRGTPDAVAALGDERGFDVVVVEPFTLDGRAVRSSEIRTAIASGDLASAAELLGRPVTLRGDVAAGSVRFEWPLAMPPTGVYRCRVDGTDGRLTIDEAAGDVTLVGVAAADGPVRVELLG